MKVKVIETIPKAMSVQKVLDDFIHVHKPQKIHWVSQTSQVLATTVNPDSPFHENSVNTLITIFYE